jgi:hypothetical protein
MSFDIFISYSHRDNKTTHPDELGWVDSFQLALDKFLTEFLGREAEIWRDLNRMPGNSRLDSAIHENLEKATILLPILSPNFMGSIWCPQELDYFLKRNSATHIFPIVKSPIPTPPDQIRDNFLKYKFYIEDKNSPSVREIDPSFGDEYRSKLNLIVSDLAREVAEFIKSVQPQTGSTLPASPAQTITVKDDRPVIYLAEPSPDLWDQYNDIKRDLEQRGCNFLPLEIDPFRKPKVADDYKQQVREDVKNCGLAVHLISGENNFFPAQCQQSYLHLQTEVAAERDSDPNFKRLIWFPRDTHGDDIEHQKFIEHIRNTASGKVEFLQNSLEDFKTFIQDALKPEPPPPTPPQPEDPPWVYVLYDQCDLESAGEVENLLQDKGCELFSSKNYIKPMLDGDTEINANELHKDWLSKCDAVLIYWRSAKYYWINNSIFDVQKSKAYRNHSFKANAVVCDGDLENEEKLDFRPRPNLLKVSTQPLTTPLKSSGYSELPDFLTRLEV